MVDFTDEGPSVVVDTVDETGDESVYRCNYLIGADGGRAVGHKLGIKMQGSRNITDMVSVHFSADLSEYWDDRYFACHFINGECGTVFESGAIVPMGPNWGKYSREWVFHFGFAMDDEKRHEEASLVPRIRELLKIPKLEMTAQSEPLGHRGSFGRHLSGGTSFSCRRCREPPSTYNRTGTQHCQDRKSVV